MATEPSEDPHARSAPSRTSWPTPPCWLPPRSRRRTP